MLFVAAAALTASRGEHRRGPIFAAAAIAGAVVAQFLLLNDHRVLGAYLYGASIAVAFVGLFTSGPAARGDWHAWTFTIRQEIALVLIVFVTLAGLRVWRIGDYPRGIEQDEASWMWMHGQIFYGYEPRDAIVTANFEQLPIGFHERRFMLDILGQTFWASRVDAMVSSLVALVLLYLLVRLLTSPAIALITLILVGTSILDLASSRLALTESLTKMWIALSYLMLILAMKRQSVRFGVASGGAMAMGMVTYITFHMTPIVAAVTLIFYFLRDAPVRAWRFAQARTAHRLRDLRSSGGIYIGLAVATLLPLLLVRDRMEDLLRRQRGFNSANWVGWSRAHPYEGSFDKLREMFSFAGHNFHLVIEELFWAQRFGDFFIIRTGDPIVIAGVLPFFAVGLAVVTKNWRKRYNTFILLWLLIQFFLAATATGAVQARVLLPGLPAFSLIAALGIYHVFSQLAAQRTGAIARWVPLVLAGGATASIGAISTHAYFNDLADPVDRLERREMVDYVREAAQDAHVVVLPYADEGPNERLEAEQQGVRFSVGSVVGQDAALEHMALVPYSSLLTAVSDRYGENVAVVWQHSITGEYDPRAETVQALKFCYPRSRIDTGEYFELIVFTFAERLCYSVSRDLVRLTTVPEQRRQVLSFSALPQASEYRVVLERLPPGVVRLEAEAALRGTGWNRHAQLTAGFLGLGFLYDAFGAETAKTTVSVPSAGDYTAWVRVYSRGETDATSFFLIDGIEATLEEGDVNRWVWRRVGRFPLAAGAHEIGVGRHYGQSRLGIFVDAVLLSPDETVDPNAGEWRTQLDSGRRPIASFHALTEADGLCDATCVPGGVLPPGEYRWRVQQFDGDMLVDHDGSIGFYSDYAYFTVTD